MTAAYEQFLRQKVKLAPRSGFEVSLLEINPLLLGHQSAAVKWAVAGGRRALFEAFGLGKTIQQIEVLRLILSRAGGRGLIVAPLGVRQEFTRDAHTLATGDHPNITDEQREQLAAWIAKDPTRAPSIRFIRSVDEADETGLYITNYETVRDGKIDPADFTATSLDEASVLRSFGSKTYQVFLDLFQQVAYRFVATATPSPNRHKELIHYAGYLGIMDTGQALTRWFKRDPSKANNLTLHPHKEDEFWLWVSSWGLFLQRPSDLGFPDDGYDLPKVHIHYHEVATEWRPTVDRDGQVGMFSDAAMDLQSAAREKRKSLDARIRETASIVAAEPDEHWLIWHDQEAERHAIDKAIPDAVAVYGSQDLEEREQAIVDFSNGRIQHLAAKPVIAGSGCNFQRHCARAVFAGIGFKFNDFIQAIHRIVRFLQTRECHIHLVYADTEREVLRTLERKWRDHDATVKKMTDIIRKYGLNHAEMGQTLARSIGVERIEARGEGWLVANNDCVAECGRMDTDSVDLVVTSIPFSNHYEYTASYNDFGHTDGNDHFWAQMNYLTPELLRVLKPGRLACIHVKDRILFGSVTGAGAPTVSPFHAEAIFHYLRHGFDYMGMITVVTDVVRENNQTYRLGWTEQCKDGTKMGVGSPEYVILVRKPQSDRSRGYADTPVVKDKADYTRARWQVDAHALWRSSGNRLLTAEEMAQLPPDVLSRVFTEWSMAEVYDYEHHVRIGEELELRGTLPAKFMSLAPGSHHPDVWHDVARMRTLNGEQTKRGLENHVCPLQFDIVDRLIRRYTNRGELVFDPFGGLFTVPYRALHLGRQGRASELNPGYFLDGVKYLEAKQREKAMPALFDFDDDMEASA